MVRKLAMGCLIGVLVFVVSAAAADSPLRVVSETDTTITFGWDDVGADGYHFYANGARVARSFNGSQLTVRFAKADSYRVGPFDVTERSDGFVWPVAMPPPPPPPPPPPTGDELIVNGNWTCNRSVNYSLVRVTSSGSGDAVRLASGCTGHIGRLEVSGARNGDGIKIQNGDTNAAHDLTIDGGYVSCSGASTDGTHQDGIQGMGGRNIIFRNFVFDCYGGGGGNYFIQRAGSGATTPTNIVCDHCALGPRHPNNVNLGTSVGAGVRNSLICSPTSGRNPFMADSGAQQVVNENNTIVPSNDPRCATLDTLIAETT